MATSCGNKSRSTVSLSSIHGDERQVLGDVDEVNGVDLSGRAKTDDGTDEAAPCVSSSLSHSTMAGSAWSPSGHLRSRGCVALRLSRRVDFPIERA